MSESEQEYTPFDSRDSANTPPAPQLSPQELNKQRHERRVERMDRVKKNLQENYFGQPRVFKAAITNERHRVVTGHMGPTEPIGSTVLRLGVVIKIIGFSGSGKDTFVYLWIDAIHNYHPDAIQNHLFILSNLGTASSITAINGASPGYQSADKVNDFIEFLVRHSGGKYMLVEDTSQPQNLKWGIVRNPEWEEGYGSRWLSQSFMMALFFSTIHMLGIRIYDNKYSLLWTRDF